AMNDTRPLRPIRLPAVDQVLRTSVGAVATARFGHDATVKAVRGALSALRDLARDSSNAFTPEADSVAAAARDRLEREDRRSLRRVFNLTGTVLHTNLGRALLPESAIAAAVEAMRSAVTLEFDMGDGRRGERDDHIRGLIRELTGAEDAVVVNN